MKEYNPLDYDNLTRNCIQELMQRGPFDIPLDKVERPQGAGVYALFYKGADAMYAKVRSLDATWPIYVGKAVPPGARKGAARAGAATLYGRINEHAKSIQAARNLNVTDFVCRYLVVTPLWITMAERFLIQHFHPVWNSCLDGFGNHAPGKGRTAGEVSWWDALHPGRPWAVELRQTRNAAQAKKKLADFLAKHEKQTLLEIFSKAAEAAPVPVLVPEDGALDDD